MRLFLDTSVLLGFFDNDERFKGAAQRLAADLQKDTLIFQCHNPNTTCFYLPSGHRHTLAFFTIAYFTIKHP